MYVLQMHTFLSQDISSHINRSIHVSKIFIFISICFFLYYHVCKFILLNQWKHFNAHYSLFEYMYNLGDSNKVYLDPMDDPTIVAAIQRGLDDDQIFADEYTKIKNEHPELDKKEIIQMAMLNRDIAERIEVRNSIRVKLRSADIASEARRLKELSRTPDLILLSGLRHKEFEDYFAKELDAHCILLETTPKLQDKGLRLAFSVGCELAIIDAETSSMLRKLTLRPSDLLTSDETGDLFGEFGVQSAMQEESDSDSDSDYDIPMKKVENKTEVVDK